MSRIFLRTVLLSIGVLIITTAFLAFERGSVSLGVVNRAFADTAFILIGISFSLSSLSHFWQFFHATIVYRKDIGLAGFAFVVAHTIVSLWFLPNRFPFPQYYLAQENILSFSFAVSALVIYSVMTAISNKAATRLLGGTLWKYLLRLGYVAYIYTILHFGLKVFGRENLAPSTIFLFVFGFIVLSLRIALWIAQTRGIKEVNGPPPQL